MKTGGSSRYYCNTRKRTGTCANGRGVPADLLEDFVQEALHEKMTDPKHVDALMEVLRQEGDRWRNERALKRGARVSLEREVTRLEAVIGRLKDAIEKGEPVGDRLKQRAAEPEGLKAKSSVKPPRS
jgi:hypothetical protein